jgi:hypothetical protein
VLLEAGEDYEDSKMEVVGASMEVYYLCGFGDDDDLELETVILSQRYKLYYAESIQPHNTPMRSMWEMLSMFKTIIYVNLGRFGPVREHLFPQRSHRYA